MDQIVAQVLVTLLVSLAFALSLGAGLSALSKWRQHRELQAEFAQSLERAADFRAKQQDEHYAFITTHPSSDWDAFHARQLEETKAAGFSPKTYGDLEVENLVGEPPRKTYQAPGEVWVGLAALTLATAANIIAVWLV